MEAVKILTLKCPNCSAALEVSPDMESFACGYCGSQQIVQRRGGTVSLKLVTDAISKVQHGTDRTASELAIQRLNNELAAAQTRLVQLEGQAGSDIIKRLVSYIAGFTLLYILAVVIIGNAIFDLRAPFDSLYAPVCASPIAVFGFFETRKSWRAHFARFDPPIKQTRDLIKSLQSQLAHHRSVVSNI